MRIKTHTGSAGTLAASLCRMHFMSSELRPSSLFVVPLLLGLLAAGLLGYWLSLRERLPEGLAMGNGRLEATEVQIASKYPGRLAEVTVQEGDRVTKGQLLARLDTRTLEAQRAQAEAEVRRADGAPGGGGAGAGGAGPKAFPRVVPTGPPHPPAARPAAGALRHRRRRP